MRQTNEELSFHGFINGYNINIMRIETLLGEKNTYERVLNMD